MYNTNMNDIAIDLTSLLPPTNSRANNKTEDKDKTTSKRRYYKTKVLTPANKVFVDEYAKTNNGTQSALKAFPNIQPDSARVKAVRLLANDNVVNHIEYQRSKLERIASHAVDRIEDHVESDDDNISLNASKFVIEQVHGKAMQKSSNVNFNFTGHVSDKAQDYGL